MSNFPSQRLDIKQQQSMVMTQSLQQSIKLLQLSSLELKDYIAEEVEQNPLLQVESDSDDFTDGDEGDNDRNSENNDQSTASNTSDTKELDYQEPDWDRDGTISSAVYENESQVFERVNNGTSSYGDSEYNIEENSTDITLKEHLLEQIYVDISCPIKRMIALHLTDMLNDNGYIEEIPKQFAASLGCTEKDITETLALVQTLDPAGVFARNLSECLALQLKDKNRLDPAMEVLLDNLELLAKGDFPRLRKLCHVSGEDLSEMIAEIKALNPKPGNNFASEVVQSMLPDVFLRREQDGTWGVELNSNILPKLLINRTYYTQVKSKTRDKEGRKYLSDQLYTASWLVKALDQRAQTILKVAAEIVAQQRDFFEKGICHLRPLTLADIAAVVNLHESTVSRVTTNKYIATHRGMYEMKYFFSSSLGDNHGSDNHSSKTVKYLIKELVNNETPDQILSDERIAELLQEKHIDIARRTVAKYREAIGIASSAERKREKRLRKV